jgi:hypothetical protein
MFCAPGLIFGGTAGVSSHIHVLRPQTHFRRYRRRRVQFSCFASPISFSAVPRASGLVFMFCAIGLIFEVPRASSPVFMFCPSGLVYESTESVGSHFHVLRSRTHFRWYRVRRVSFSSFAFGLIFGGTKGVRSRFSCFPLPDTSSAVPSASGPFFMFCATGHIFGGTEGVVSRLHVLRSPTHFRRYRGRRVPFSCFAFPDSFSAVPRASGPIFMSCAHVLVFIGIEGVRSRFLVLLSQTHFRRCRVRRVLFSYFLLPGMFSAVPRASCPVFMFCAPGLIFYGTEGV